MMAGRHLYTSIHTMRCGPPPISLRFCSLHDVCSSTRISICFSIHPPVYLYIYTCTGAAHAHFLFNLFSNIYICCMTCAHRLNLLYISICISIHIYYIYMSICKSVHIYYISIYIDMKVDMYCSPFDK